MQLLSIDPGTHYTGYALWEQSMNTLDLHYYGLIKAGQSDSWKCRAHIILQMSEGVGHVVKDTIIEFPEFQAGGRGMSSSRGGDTLKLAYLCGLLASRCAHRVKLVTPSEWKGQLSKEMTFARMKKHFPLLEIEYKIDYNWADAIALAVMTNTDKKPIGPGMIRMDI